MRLFAIACAAAGLLASAAQAEEIKTGRDLLNACRDEANADTDAARAAACDTFLKGFFLALVDRQRAREDAMVKGLPSASKEACVRMPDRLTRKEMAGRIVAFTSNDSTAMDQAAAIVAQRTLEHDFPCPQQTPAPG